jgi:hypothetical protein
MAARCLAQCRSVFTAEIKPDTTRGVSSYQLAKHRLSDNVGGVKPFLSVLLCALRRARHFALVEKQLPVPTKARS